MSMPLYDRISLLDFHTPYVKKSFVGYVLLSKTEQYVNGAIIQWNRIQSIQMKMGEDLENTFREMEQNTTKREEILKIEDSQLPLLKVEDFQLLLQELKELREQRNINFGTSENQRMDTYTLFMDIHFYIICCDKVKNLIEKLEQKESNADLSKLWKELEEKFIPYNKVRNHLEHIEDRTKPKYTHDMGNLNGDKFIFGGEEFDISIDSLKFICDSYERVFDILIK